MANIPGYLDDPLSYVLEAVDSAVGEGTTPIHMTTNEKDIEESPDSTKSVLFKSKIHVDKISVLARPARTGLVGSWQPST